jgi:hypothetical protein
VKTGRGRYDDVVTPTREEMTIAELEAEFAAAKHECERAGAALRGKHRGNEWADFGAAQERLLRAERALAEGRSEEHAVPCSGFPPWDTGAPFPRLFSERLKTTLVYLTREPDPTWDGRTARAVDPGDEALHIVAVVQFHRVKAVRMGDPNDEVLHGHPLFGKGLAMYEPHVVMRSSWLSELRRINSVHSAYNPAPWERFRHYLLAFHDETFECVAESFTATTKLTSLKGACRDAFEDLLR